MKDNFVCASHARICIPSKKNLKLPVRAAVPLIFAPLHPSRAARGEEMQFELFLKYTAELCIRVSRWLRMKDKTTKTGTFTMRVPDF